MNSFWPFRAPKKHSSSNKSKVQRDSDGSLMNQILKKLRSVDCLPVRVLESTDPDGYNGMLFDGDLDDFIETIKALKIQTVFVSARVFDDEDIHEATELSESALEPHTKRQLAKAIDVARCHVGKDCELRLMVRNAEFELNLHHAESWWRALIDAGRIAMGENEMIESQRDEQEGREFEDRRKRVIDEIKRLIADDSFVSLPTQRAMVAYAADSIEDVSVLDEAELKTEIQKLNDKLVARGLRKS